MKNRGFTIVELAVVISLIALFSLILISNFPQAKVQFSLSRVAYKFAQDVRKTQGMSLSYLQDERGVYAFGDIKRGKGISLAAVQQYKVSQPVTGYGVYVDLSHNKRYIIYADSNGDTSYQQGDSTIIQTVDFSLTEPGVVIKEIQNIGNNQNNQGDEGDQSENSVSINFTSPNPTTVITPSPIQNTVKIIFALASNLNKIKTVSINTAGLVEVK